MNTLGRLVMSIAVAACLGACSAGSGTSATGAGQTIDPLDDFAAAFKGTPSARTRAIATAINATLTQAERAHLVAIDWSAINGDGVLADPVITKALGAVPADGLSTTTTASVRSALLSPKVCAVDALTCSMCQDELTQALTEVVAGFRKQAVTEAAACLLAGPLAEVVCPVVVAHLLWKVTKIADKLFQCSGTQSLTTQSVLSDLVDSVKAKLKMCEPTPDMAMPPDMTMPPDMAMCMQGCASGRVCLMCGGKAWCVPPGATCCEAGGCQCYLQQQAPGTICCPSQGADGQPALSFAWCQYSQGAGSPCLWHPAPQRVWSCE